MPWWKCARCALSMDINHLFYSINCMLFKFCHIMRHVINELHSKIIHIAPEKACKCLTYPVSDDLPVCPGIIRTCCHGFIIILAFRGFGWRACKLPVGKLDTVLACCFVKYLQIIITYL